jgi:hypothetical protein
MGWVKWLTGKSAAEPAAKPVPPPKPAARPRKGGEAYAGEWVKVLEESAAERDPGGTYTWELQTDGLPQPASEAGRPRRKPAPTEPYDTFTWELQEGDTPEDPWGLQKKEAEAATAKKQEGINPYDTGVFDASWTGRFDRR